jgi:phage FluMu protein Com
MSDTSGEDRPLVVVEEVRCLDCGQVYAKPAAGGTARTNPGCPRCGYVGWVDIKKARWERGRRRFDVDPLPRRSVQSG